MAIRDRKRTADTTRAGRAGRKRKAGATTQDDALSLAQTITGSRQQFAQAFRAAQGGRAEVLEFEAVASAVTDTVAAYTRAFTRAAELGWLRELCVTCVTHNIVEGAFLALAAEMLPESRLARLQAMVDPDRGFGDPLVFGRRLVPATLQVCRIEIDQKHVGTGFLVRSDLVMTAHHVIRPLLNPAFTASVPGSAAKLRVRFDYARDFVNGAIALSEGFTCRVAEDWLAKTSSCTAEELLDTLPKDFNLLAGFWDYAVIRLADLPGYGRNGLPLKNRAVKRRGALTIIQHPQNEPVAYATSTVSGFLGDGGFRVVHLVNTKDGSSGSPCLDSDFEVVCLHQGAMPPGPKAVNGAPERNRAIPMSRILSEWQVANEPPSAEARLLTADTTRVAEHPIFGRVTLQHWLTRSAAARGKDTVPDRFLAVSGPPGAGKSFTTEIMRAALPPAEHQILECLASDFGSTPAALDFAVKYLLDPIGGDASNLPPLEKANSSDNAWLNYQFIGDLLAEMDRARGDRMIWLVLDELDDAALPDQGQVRKLLDLIYTRAQNTPWLRIVLLGLDAAPVPNTATRTTQDFVGYQQELALANDVIEYLVHRLGAKGLPHEPLVRAQALTAVQQAVARFAGRLDHPDLLRTIADDAIRFEVNFGLRKG